MSAADDVTEAALTLKPRERARLAERLIKSLQSSPPPFKNATDGEFVRRIKSVEDVSQLQTLKADDGVIRRALRTQR